MLERQPVQPLIFFKTDQNGFILNQTEINNVCKEWKSVLEDIKYTFQRYSYGKLHSLYLSGNFITTKNPKIDSETQVIIIGTEEFGISWLKDYNKYLFEKYPFTENLDFILQTFPVLMNNDFLKFKIKTKALCIMGNDLLEEIPKYRISSEIAFVNRTIEEDLKKCLNILVSNKNNENTILNICPVITKIIISSGFEICIDKEKRYTEDIFTCYKVFSKYFPDKEIHMRKVYKLYKEPSSEYKKVVELITGIGRWLILKIRLDNLEKKFKTNDF